MGLESEIVQDLYCRESTTATVHIGSYLETIDVYLLAKTYAYTEVDEQNLLTHFNGFVRHIDLTYTNQRNWHSWLNFYSHIDASGLTTSTHRYGQALAHLGNGDRLSATEQLIQLENDNFVGEQATIALNKLAGQSGEIAIRSTPYHRINNCHDTPSNQTFKRMLISPHYAAHDVQVGPMCREKVAATQGI